MIKVKENIPTVVYHFSPYRTARVFITLSPIGLRFESTNRVRIERLESSEWHLRYILYEGKLKYVAVHRRFIRKVTQLEEAKFSGKRLITRPFTDERI